MRRGCELVCYVSAVRRGNKKILNVLPGLWEHYCLIRSPGERLRWVNMFQYRLPGETTNSPHRLQLGPPQAGTASSWDLPPPTSSIGAKHQKLFLVSPVGTAARLIVRKRLSEHLLRVVKQMTALCFVTFPRPGAATHSFPSHPAQEKQHWGYSLHTSTYQN